MQKREPQHRWTPRQRQSFVRPTEDIVYKKWERKKKLRERFLKFPTDFTFDEMQSLLEGYGYERCNKGKTSGSRIIFKNGNKRPIMLHKPHPGNIVKEYAMKQVFEDLKTAGFIKTEEK